MNEVEKKQVPTDAVVRHVKNLLNKKSVQVKCFNHCTYYVYDTNKKLIFMVYAYQKANTDLEFRIAINNILNIPQELEQSANICDGDIAKRIYYMIHKYYSDNKNTSLLNKTAFDAENTQKVLTDCINKDKKRAFELFVEDLLKHNLPIDLIERSYYKMSTSKEIMDGIKYPWDSEAEGLLLYNTKKYGKLWSFVGKDKTHVFSPLDNKVINMFKDVHSKYQECSVKTFGKEKCNNLWNSIVYMLNLQKQPLR